MYLHNHAIYILDNVISLFRSSGTHVLTAYIPISVCKHIVHMEDSGAASSVLYMYDDGIVVCV